MNKKLELLPPQPQENLAGRLAQLENLLKYKQTYLEKAPPGGLHIIKCHGSPQYYLRFRNKSDGVSLTYTYIPRKDILQARRLAQKEYDKKIASLLRKHIKWLKKQISRQPPCLTEVYDSLSSQRQNLVSPVTLPDCRYADIWQKVPYVHKDFNGSYTEHFTVNGQQVRSKSEVLIANELIRQGIPFRYEFPVEMTEGQILHPDFYCLKLQNRQEIIWEHLGMCDQAEYAVNAMGRLALYQKNGWFPGKNLIFTFETQNQPLTLRDIRKVLGEYFS